MPNSLIPQASSRQRGSIGCLCNKESHHETPLHLAADNDHKEIVELLLASNADYNIFDAAAVGDLEKVKSLLKDNPSLASIKNNEDGFASGGEFGYAPLHFAAKNGHKEIAKLLLANKVNVNATDMEAQMI
jgi:ankyrin repeat protein